MQAAALPDSRGYFGMWGGRFVPETLVPALDELTAAFESLATDTAFWSEFASYCSRLRRQADAALPRGCADSRTAAAPPST